jgi:hypothetical protein
VYATPVSGSRHVQLAGGEPSAHGGRVTLSLRVAEADGAQWLGLGDDAGRVARVAEDGWSVERGAPVLFRRTALTASLPTPIPGGSLDCLRRLVNSSDADWPLILAVVVAALLPNIPHPVVVLQAEQGLGKSTAARLLGSLLDPSTVPLREPPKDGEAWTLPRAAPTSWWSTTSRTCLRGGRTRCAGQLPGTETAPSVLLT